MNNAWDRPWREAHHRLFVPPFVTLHLHVKMAITNSNSNSNNNNNNPFLVTAQATEECFRCCHSCSMNVVSLHAAEVTCAWLHMSWYETCQSSAGNSGNITNNNKRLVLTAVYCCLLLTMAIPFLFLPSILSWCCCGCNRPTTWCHGPWGTMATGKTIMGHWMNEANVATLRYSCFS